MSADDPSSTSPFLYVDPPSFTVELVLHHETFVDLLLDNPTDSIAVFKIKTTAKDRYMLRPTQDFILPHSKKICKIVLNKLHQYPAVDSKSSSSSGSTTGINQIRDKFLIQSALIDRSTHESIVSGSTLQQWWKERESQHRPKENSPAFAEQIVRSKLLWNTNASGQQQAQIQSQSTPQAPTSQHQQQPPQQRSAADNYTSEPLSTPTQQVQSQSTPSARTQLTQQPLPTSTNNDQNIDQFLASRMDIVNQSRTKYSTANEADVSAFDRVQSERSQKDYQELMEFCVKLTTQLEQEKAQRSTLQQQYDKQQKQADTLQAQVEALEKQAESDRRQLSKAGITVSDRVQSAPGSSASSSLQQATATTAGGISLVQLVLVALAAFVLGQVFKLGSGSRATS